MTSQSPFLGILSLDTAFERIVGDAGNPASYPFAVRVAVVAGADSPKIVQGNRPTQDLVARFVAEARRLEREGAVAIVSTCGFLVSVQADIAAAVRIPVLLSALSLGPAIIAMTGRPLGVLTASAKTLGPSVLASAGLQPDQVRIAGLEDCPAFATAFLAPKTRQSPCIDTDAVRLAVLERARGVIADQPDTGGLLLECGNLPPYAEDIRAATGLPVFHLLDGAAHLWAATTGPATGSATRQGG